MVGRWVYFKMSRKAWCAHTQNVFSIKTTLIYIPHAHTILPNGGAVHWLVVWTCFNMFLDVPRKHKKTSTYSDCLGLHDPYWDARLPNANTGLAVWTEGAAVWANARVGVDMTFNPRGHILSWVEQSNVFWTTWGILFGNFCRNYISAQESPNSKISAENRFIKLPTIFNSAKIGFSWAESGYNSAETAGNSAEIAGNSAEICRHVFWL